MDDGTEYLMGLFTGFVVFLVFLLFFMPPTASESICEYEGGKMKADVCIVDGKVFDIE